ncbi:MAG: hypothetical protein QCI00_09530, partial [Candidatus Thermoplasmatota archaeon]|nr:hypothetical protein [Candidatus Thermoplasmatota archaeon]
MKVEQKILFCVGIILALTMAAGSASAAITVDSFTKLTDNPYTDSVPDWSPDDTKIIYMAYTSNWWTHSRIVEMNSDGTGKDEVIPETAWFARYSPDGTKIAYASYPPDGSLSLKDLNSGSVEILVSGEGIYEGVVPDWSPDGKKIVYSRYKWSDKLGQIWIYDLESKTNTKISTDDTVDERYPAWS